MGVKFYCSLTYTYNPLFKLDLDDVARFVNEKRPTVKYQKGVVLIIDDKRMSVEQLKKLREE